MRRLARYHPLKKPLPPSYDERETLSVGGFARTYWVAPQAPGTRGPDGASRLDGDGRPPPLLLAFHGQGSSGSRLAWWSGLGPRGPLAGFRCVFPDGLEQIWDDHGCGRTDGADDAAFVAALVDRLAETGAADPDRVFVTGVSTGAAFAERIVRTGVLDVAGAALVAGTARVASRDAAEIAAPPTPILMLVGTADRMVPYGGGPPGGSMGKIALVHVKRMLVDPRGHASVAPQELAAEWAAVNGCRSAPTIDAPRLTCEACVRRMTWASHDAATPPVVLYRIDGGGHGWPGARQYLPPRLIGRIPQGIDGTAIVLDFARAATGMACGLRAEARTRAG